MRRMILALKRNAKIKYLRSILIQNIGTSDMPCQDIQLYEYASIFNQWNNKSYSFVYSLSVLVHIFNSEGQIPCTVTELFSWAALKKMEYSALYHKCIGNKDYKNNIVIGNTTPTVRATTIRLGVTSKKDAPLCPVLFPLSDLLVPLFFELVLVVLCTEVVVQPHPLPDDPPEPPHPHPEPPAPPHPQPDPDPDPDPEPEPEPDPDPPVGVGTYVVDVVVLFLQHVHGLLQLQPHFELPCGTKYPSPPHSSFQQALSSKYLVDLFWRAMTRANPTASKSVTNRINLVDRFMVFEYISGKIC
jgi:hypothetical protein